MVAAEAERYYAMDEAELQTEATYYGFIGLLILTIYYFAANGRILHRSVDSSNLRLRT